jgi:hypothetical protein
VISAALAAGIPCAQAKQQYWIALLKFYPGAHSATKLRKCQTCHGGNGLNDYGRDFAHNAHPAPSQYDFGAIDEWDSDHDGAINRDEITTQGSNPGKAE